jgi:glycosyltransferase involved in cell wall biosynthesis
MLHDDIKWGAYYGAEAFILPSHQENFGIVVAEALACGRPALLSDKVNIADDVRDAGAAYVEHDTAEGTLNLITRWIATPAEERKRMEDNALACFRQHYDMRENAKSTVRIFEQITRERQKK